MTEPINWRAYLLPADIRELEALDATAAFHRRAIARVTAEKNRLRRRMYHRMWTAEVPGYREAENARRRAWGLARPRATAGTETERD